MEEIAKSVIVRADDFQHLIENLFHLPHQRELGAGAVEVVIRASKSGIDEDIVDLGVIVGDAQRNFASCQLIQQVGSETDFRTVAETLGKFQNQLEDYPASTLHETIARPSASAARAFSKLA